MGSFCCGLSGDDDDGDGEVLGSEGGCVRGGDKVHS